MQKSIIIACLFILFQTLSFAQVCESNRYQEAIFSSVDKTENLVYSNADVYDIFNLPINFDFKLDIYEPAGDDLAKRPLVIMSFGGAYVIGDKEHADIVAWCDSLARYGYVAVAIDYRLGVNPLSPGSAVRAMYRGVQDTRAAIRYMLEHQTEYRIDPEYIYLGGESAGAINSMHAAFMTTEAERPEASTGITLENFDLGCLDCIGNEFQHDFNIKGVINLWGGTMNLDMITANEQIPTLIIHGEDDFIVPYDEGYPFISQFQLSFPYLYASKAIHDHMDDLGIYNEYYIYPGEGHLFYGLPDGIITFPNENWNPVWTQGHEFLYKTMEFDTPNPIGETQTNTVSHYTYSVPMNPGSEYCWTVTGGTILSTNNNEIVVQWDGGTGEISVTETNCIRKVGRESDLMIVESSVSNPDIESELGVSIFPTQIPQGQNLHIQNPASLKLDIMISDVNGKILERRTIRENAEINLHEQATNGVGNYYFLTISHEGKRYVEKVLVY